MRRWALSPVFAYHPDGPRFLIGGERNAVGIAFNTPYEEECLLFLEFLTHQRMYA